MIYDFEEEVVEIQLRECASGPSSCRFMASTPQASNSIQPPALSTGPASFPWRWWNPTWEHSQLSSKKSACQLVSSFHPLCFPNTMAEYPCPDRPSSLQPTYLFTLRTSDLLTFALTCVLEMLLLLFIFNISFQARL